MMKTVLLALLAAPAICSAQTVYVRPYINSDLQVVPGHFRTAPNGTQFDNYSAQGNVNPWTGGAGRRSTLPSYSYQPPPPPMYRPQQLPQLLPMPRPAYNSQYPLHQGYSR